MMNARLEELRSKFQENPRRYFAPFANELRKAGDTAQAISVCRAHLVGQPGHVSGHIVLGQALYEAGEANEARDIFTAALELDPENLIALRTLGEIAQVNGEFGTARQWYERLLDADPRNTEVAQFLRDLPAESVPAPEAASAAIADEEEDADRLPFNARPEAEAAPPTPVPAAPAPTFHTSFTGSSPVISSDADEPSREESRAETVDNAPVEFAAPEPEAEPVVASAPDPSDDIEMIDFDSFSTYSPAPESVAHTSTPDESFEAVPDEELDDAYIVDFDPASLDAAEPVAASEPELAGEAESTSEPDVEPSASEPTRAIFAEFGFDGPANDQIGWVTTPSASLSEPESAPETWLEETATSEDAAPAEAESHEPATAELITPDHATDSWFDDVGGASVIETTVVSNEEFWLPPDLTSVPTSASPETEPVAAAEEGSTAELEPEVTANAAEPAAEPTMAAAELHNDYAEPETPGYVEAVGEVEEPVSLEVEHSPAPTYWSEPVAAAQDAPEEPAQDAREEPAHVEHVSPLSDSYWIDPVAAAPSEASSMEQERSEDHATPEWSEPAVAEMATPVAESSYPAPPALSYYSTPIPEPEEPTEPVLEAVERETPAAEPEVAYAASEDSPETAAVSEAPEEVNDAEEFSRSASIAEAMPPAEVVMGLTPSSVAVVPPAAPAPFVTETLAELYLQQGFREEALSIYRQLVDRDPANQSLRDRVAQLERGDVAATAATVNEPPVENRASSQSVRSFFSRLARRPASTPTRSTESAYDASKANPDVPFAAAASALANLFSASKPPASDEGAASTLAGAFTDPAGRPSRAADRELSLDHLFRDVPPGGSASGSVSLDEFYATPNAAQDSSTESSEAAEPGTGDPGGTDIRQFTAWLEGLRKK